MFFWELNYYRAGLYAFLSIVIHCKITGRYSQEQIQKVHSIIPERLMEKFEIWGRRWNWPGLALLQIPHRKIQRRSEHEIRRFKGILVEERLDDEA